MKQPFEAITRIGEWCLSRDIDWAICGSWSLLLHGVRIDPPWDLDLMIGVDNLSEFFDENTWIHQRSGESVGRSMIVEDVYAVDVIPCLTSFQWEVLARSQSINWGGWSVKLVSPLDQLLFDAGHPWYEGKHVSKCKAILDWVFAQKEPKVEHGIKLEGGDTGRHWAAGTVVYDREFEKEG